VPSLVISVLAVGQRFGFIVRTDRQHRIADADDRYTHAITVGVIIQKYNAPCVI